METRQISTLKNSVTPHFNFSEKPRFHWITGTFSVPNESAPGTFQALRKALWECLFCHDVVEILDIPKPMCGRNKQFKQQCPHVTWPATSLSSLLKKPVLGSDLAISIAICPFDHFTELLKLKHKALSVFEPWRLPKIQIPSIPCLFSHGFTQFLGDSLEILEADTPSSIHQVTAVQNNANQTKSTDPTPTQTQSGQSLFCHHQTSWKSCGCHPATLCRPQQKFQSWWDLPFKRMRKQRMMARTWLSNSW